METDLKPPVPSLRKNLVMAATSVCSRLELFRQVLQFKGISNIAIGNYELSAGIASAFETTAEEVETTLQELINSLPGEDDLNNPTKTKGGKKEEGEDPNSQEDDDGYDLETFGRDAVTVKQLRASTDQVQLQRCIAYMEQRIVELRSTLASRDDEVLAIQANMKRKDRMFDYVKRELQKEMQMLRQASTGEASMDPHGVFSTIDLMVMLSDSGTDADTAQMLQQMVVLLTQEENKAAVTDAKFLKALSQISTLQAEKKKVEQNLEMLSKKYVEEFSKMRSEKLTQERSQRHLTEQIAELSGRLQKLTAKHEELNEDYESLLEENEALHSQVELSEQTTKAAMETLYVQIASLTTKLHAEQLKKSKKFTLDPDPSNVRLAEEIASTRKAQRTDKETLNRLLSVTDRPDDPRQTATLEAMQTRIAHLKAELDVWRRETISTSIERNKNEATTAELQEDITRIYGCAADKHLDLPLDLVKARGDLNSVNTLADDVDFRPVVRTLRSEASAVAKRLYFMRSRLKALLPNKSDDSSDDSDFDQTTNSEGVDEKDINKLLNVGGLRDEVNAVETMELHVKQRIQGDAERIRTLKSDLGMVELMRSRERDLWLQQWESLLSQLPPTLAAEIRTDGLEVFKNETAMANLKEIVERAKQVVDEEQKKKLLERDLNDSFSSDDKPQPPPKGKEKGGKKPGGKKVGGKKANPKLTKKPSSPILSTPIEDSPGKADPASPPQGISRTPSLMSPPPEKDIVVQEVLSIPVGMELVKMKESRDFGAQCRPEIEMTALQHNMTTQTEGDLKAYFQSAAAAIQATPLTRGWSMQTENTTTVKTSTVQTEGAMFDQQAANTMLHDLGHMLEESAAGFNSLRNKKDSDHHKKQNARVVCPDCGFSFKDGSKVAADAELPSNGTQVGSPYFNFRAQTTQTLNLNSVLPPMGLVTMVFTDIQGSTALWEKFPLTMKEILNIHNDTMREICLKHNGYEVKTEGDAFFVAFHNVLDAFLYCTDVQSTLMDAKWPEERVEMHDTDDIYENGVKIFSGARVRMGINCGQPTCEHDPISMRMDYFGPIVNLSARVSGVAKGGEIVIGENAMRHVRKAELHKDGRFDFFNKGKKKFKGVKRLEEIYSVLPSDLKNRRRYWGRQEEEEKTAALLAEEKRIAEFLERSRGSSPVEGAPSTSLGLQRTVTEGRVKRMEFLIEIDDEHVVTPRRMGHRPDGGSGFMWMLNGDEDDPSLEVSRDLASIVEDDVDKDSTVASDSNVLSPLMGSPVASFRKPKPAQVETCDAEVQADPVVVLTDNEFASLKQASSPTAPSRPPSTPKRRSSTPKKAGKLPPTPTRPASALLGFAAVAQMIQGDAESNSVYESTVTKVVEAIKQVVPEELREDKTRATKEEELLLGKSLQQLAVLHNARCLAGLPEADIDTALRINISAATQRMLMEFRAADRPLDIAIPYTFLTTTERPPSFFLTSDNELSIVSPVANATPAPPLATFNKVPSRTDTPLSPAQEASSSTPFENPSLHHTLSSLLSGVKQSLEMHAARTSPNSPTKGSTPSGAPTDDETADELPQPLLAVQRKVVELEAAMAEASDYLDAGSFEGTWASGGQWTEIPLDSGEGLGGTRAVRTPSSFAGSWRSSGVAVAQSNVQSEEIIPPLNPQYDVRFQHTKKATIKEVRELGSRGDIRRKLHPMSEKAMMLSRSQSPPHPAFHSKAHFGQRGSGPAIPSGHSGAPEGLALGKIRTTHASTPEPFLSMDRRSTRGGGVMAKAMPNNAVEKVRKAFREKFHSVSGPSGRSSTPLERSSSSPVSKRGLPSIVGGSKPPVAKTRPF